MSASLYRWMPRCDGHYCPGDCDECPEKGNEMSVDEVMNDLQYPQPEKKRDLVEVCRCANCKDWYPFSDKLFGYCRRQCWEDDGQYRLKVETNHDDYCSYGEKQT